MPVGMFLCNLISPVDHVDEVRSIIQRATKDVAIESSLKTYEEVWLSKIFDLRLHSHVKGPSSAAAVTHEVSNSERQIRLRS